MEYENIIDKYTKQIETGYQLNKAAFDNLVTELRSVFPTTELEKKVKEYAHPQINNTGITKFINSLYE
ncbi:MAG: hypothetical protein ACMXX9_01115 [Candidatus Woesearchaeota archaeon]